MYDYIEGKVIPESNRLLKITRSIPALDELSGAILAVQGQIDRRLDGLQVEGGSDDFEPHLERIAVQVDNYFHINPAPVGDRDLTRCTEMDERQFSDGKKTLVRGAMDALMGYGPVVLSLDVPERLAVLAHLQDIMDKPSAMHSDVKKATRWTFDNPAALVDTLTALVRTVPPILSDRTPPSALSAR